MAAERHPFKFARNQITIHGGYSKKESNIDFRRLPTGEEIVCIGPSNRNLARYFGLQMDATRPWTDVTLVAYAQKLRDDEVDRMIVRNAMTDDPLASIDEADVEQKLPLPTVGRAAAYDRMSWPPMIDMTTTAFVTADGKQVPPMTIKVVPCRRRSAILEVELKEEVFDWLVDAIWHDWSIVEHDSPKWSRSWKRDLPALSQPNTKWFKKNNQFRIGVSWRCSDGKIKNKSTEVQLRYLEDADVQKSVIDQIEQEMQSTYDRNHVAEPQHENATPCAQACTEGNTSTDAPSL